MCLVSDRLNDGWQQGSSVLWEDHSPSAAWNGGGEAEAEQPDVECKGPCMEVSCWRCRGTEGREGFERPWEERLIRAWRLIRF